MFLYQRNSRSTFAKLNWGVGWGWDLGVEGKVLMSKGTRC